MSTPSTVPTTVVECMTQAAGRLADLADTVEAYTPSGGGDADPAFGAVLLSRMKEVVLFPFLSSFFKSFFCVFCVHASRRELMTTVTMHVPSHPSAAVILLLLQRIHTVMMHVPTIQLLLWRSATCSMSAHQKKHPPLTKLNRITHTV